MFRNEFGGPLSINIVAIIIKACNDINIPISYIKIGALVPEHQEALKSKLGEKHAILGKKTKHYRNSTLFNVKPSHCLVAYQFLKHLLKKKLSSDHPTLKFILHVT